jgi:hypothetical protein
MPLIQCHECSTQVSDHARICPKCGAPVIATIKRRQKAALIDLGVRAGFALIFIIIITIWFHHTMHKVMAPLNEALKEQQSQQQQKWAASPPMVVNFQPPPVQPPPEPAWVRQIKLGGISGTPDHRLAIINGKTFGAGDVATVKITGKGVTIHCLAIGESSVSISMDGIDGKRELQLTGN